MTPQNLAGILLIFGLIQALTVADVNAQSQSDKLRAIERERLKALVDADMPTATRLHADDFELIDPRGGTHSKEEYLQRIASGDLNYLEWEPDEIRVRRYGNSAVLRYKANLRVSVRGSAGRPVRFWHTDLYEKRNGRWQIVWAHASQMPDATAGKLSDEQQIVEVAQKWQHEWNRHDIKALASLVAEEADVVSASGTRLRSRKEFEENDAKSHAGMLKGSIWTNHRLEVEFVRPDIAIANGEWSITGVKERDGTLRPPQRGTFTWMLEKRNESWLIIAAQNTFVR